MQMAVRMHLTYLVLSLHRANGATIPQLMPALLSYTDQITAAHDVIGKQEMMKRGVNDSIFVRWYGIGKLLENLKDWENTPGDVEGIFQKAILPQLRKDKDPRIIGYWDARIQREANDAKGRNRTFDAEQFDQVLKPNLLWSRAQEFLAIGQRNRAINEMFAIIKAYPAHPNSAGWIDNLVKLVSPPE